jgi:hypothetical protein
MIDLMKKQVLSFSWAKKNLGCHFSRCNFTYRKQNEELGKIKKYDMVFGADGASRIHRMQRQSMFNYSQGLLMWLKN